MATTFLSIGAAACSDKADDSSATTASTTTQSQECLENGEPPEGSLFCVGADAAEEEPVALPDVSDQAPSTLQFRVVRGDAAECSIVDANPASEASAVLADQSGECFDVRSAGLEFDRVQAVKATRYDGALLVHLRLTEKDRVALNGFASQVVGDRVAIVIFGRVQSVVTINATEFGPELSISGLSLDAAARVKAALT